MGILALRAAIAAPGGTGSRSTIRGPALRSFRSLRCRAGAGAKRSHSEAKEVVNPMGLQNSDSAT